MMAVQNTTPAPDPFDRRRTRLRALGAAVLLLGLAAAGAVYWTGAPADDLSADPVTARAFKTESRDVEINFGKTGLLLNNLMADLKDPATQAVLIVIVSTLVASGCFYFARWPEPGAEPNDPVA